MTRTFYWLFLCSMLVSIHGALAQQSLSLNRPSIAKSYVNSRPASLAFDNKGDTRWESESSDPQYIIVDLGSDQTIDRVRLTWENAYAANFTLDISSVILDDPSDAAWSNIVGSTWTTIKAVQGNNTTTNEYPNLGKHGRYLRLNGTTRATSYGYSIFEFEVFNFSINTANNLALGKQGYASSTQGGFPPNQAFDNDNSTRWGSSSADNQWLYVDLKGTASISRIYLIWETAYGKDFRLEVSNDATNWTTISNTTGNTLRYNDYTYTTPVTGRYVRMYGVTRGTGYGFSLYEFQVYGTITPLPVQLAGFSAQRQATGVALNWATASELHNKGFEVQRSTDGQDFTALTFVAGAGSSAQARSYQYLDAAAPAGLCYYRLKQIDHDGTSAYSPTVAVAARLAIAPLAALSVFPNPATAHTTLSYEAPAAQAARWTLRNALGQAVGGGELQVAAGPNALPVPLAGLAAGSYVLTLDVPGQTQQRTRVQVQ